MGRQLVQRVWGSGVGVGGRTSCRALVAFPVLSPLLFMPLGFSRGDHRSEFLLLPTVPTLLSRCGLSSNLSDLPVNPHATSSGVWDPILLLHTSLELSSKFKAQVTVAVSGFSLVSSLPFYLSFPRNNSFNIVGLVAFLL